MSNVSPKNLSLPVSASEITVFNKPVIRFVEDSAIGVYSGNECDMKNLLVQFDELD